jgi:hypothetical protein
MPIVCHRVNILKKMISEPTAYKHQVSTRAEGAPMTVKFGTRPLILKMKNSTSLPRMYAKVEEEVDSEKEKVAL